MHCAPCPEIRLVYDDPSPSGAQGRCWNALNANIWRRCGTNECSRRRAIRTFRPQAADADTQSWGGEYDAFRRGLAGSSPSVGPPELPARRSACRSRRAASGAPSSTLSPAGPIELTIPSIPASWCSMRRLRSGTRPAFLTTIPPATRESRSAGPSRTRGLPHPPLNVRDRRPSLRDEHVDLGTRRKLITLTSGASSRWRAGRCRAGCIKPLLCGDSLEASRGRSYDDIAVGRRVPRLAENAAGQRGPPTAYGKVACLDPPGSRAGRPAPPRAHQAMHGDVPPKLLARELAGRNDAAMPPAQLGGVCRRVACRDADYRVSVRRRCMPRDHGELFPRFPDRRQPRPSMASISGECPATGSPGPVAVCPLTAFQPVRRHLHAVLSRQ